ncbi:hypothetical protein T492DRAFT_972904, partial [Pavlovales sp. CCMP2436]
MSAVSRVCVIVGAGPGLGGSVAFKFAKEGYKVFVLSRTEPSVALTLTKLSDAGLSATFIATDASNKAAVEAAFGEIGKVDVLVYNASSGGGGRGGGILDISAETVQSSMDISVIGALLCVQAVLPGRGAERLHPLHRRDCCDPRLSRRRSVCNGQAR